MYKIQNNDDKDNVIQIQLDFNEDVFESTEYLNFVKLSKIISKRTQWYIQTENES